MKTNVEIYWQSVEEHMPPFLVPVLVLRKDMTLTIGIYSYHKTILRCFDYSAKAHLEGQEFPTHWSCNYRVV